MDKFFDLGIKLFEVLTEPIDVLLNLKLHNGLGIAQTVLFGSNHAVELASACNQACQELFGFRGRGLRMRTYDLGEVSQVVGVDAIGLCQAAVGPGEVTNSFGVDDGHCELAGAQRSKGSLLVATGGFQDDQGRLVLEEKIGEFTDAFGVVGKSPGFLGVPEGQVEMVFGDIDADKDLGRS